MALLDNHLEQISLSAAAIAELPFPPPKKFTNALLRPHDITALIRDTEAHERVLFKFAPAESASSQPYETGPRRATVFGTKGKNELFVNGVDFPRPPRQRSVVTTLLGTEYGEQLRNGGAQAGRERGEVDVNLLLKGAERLCSIYPMAGASDKISSLRSRFDQLTASVSRYEARVSKQAAQLAKRNRREESNDDQDDTSLGESADLKLNDGRLNEAPITAADLEREEQEIRELERKKQTLEDRLSGMERDLGGLLR
ncbi:MAG: hypothetical protein Q9224_001137 [Gallowayella concinna]